MRERLPLPWKLARSLLSKQMRVSWCGLSFPPSWRCYSTKVWGLWEKPVRARGEEMCIYLCWWGTTSTLICLRAARGSPHKQPKPWGHCLSPERCGMMEVHRLAAAGVVKIKLHADAKFVDVNYSMNGRRIAPNSKPADCPFYPNWVAVINGKHEIKCCDMTRSMLFSSNETWRRVHGGDLPAQDMISWGLVFHPCPNLNHWANNLLFVLFFPP